MLFNKRTDHISISYLLSINLISIFDASRVLDVLDGFVRMRPRRDDNRR